MRSQQGFTLIEIIVSLMLVSILAVAAGYGIVEVAKSYQFAQENAAMAQKAHIALQRISLELMDLSSVTTANEDDIEIETPNGTRSLELDGTNLWLNDDTSATNGEILIDNVSDFELKYVDSKGGNWTKQVGVDNVDELFGIEISLTLSREDGISPIEFESQITPRHNGNRNAPY